MPTRLIRGLRRRAATGLFVALSFFAPYSAPWSPPPPSRRSCMTARRFEAYCDESDVTAWNCNACSQLSEFTVGAYLYDGEYNVAGYVGVDRNSNAIVAFSWHPEGVRVSGLAGAHAQVLCVIELLPRFSVWLECAACFVAFFGTGTRCWTGLQQP